MEIYDSRGVCEPEANQIQHMLNARIIAPKGYQEMKRPAFSALLAPIGAASFLKEGYVVSGYANASQYTERLEEPSKNGNLNCVQYIKDPGGLRHSKRFRRGKKALRILQDGPRSERDRELLVRYGLLNASFAHMIFYFEELYLPLEKWYIIPNLEG